MSLLLLVKKSDALSVFMEYQFLEEETKNKKLKECD